MMIVLTYDIDTSTPAGARRLRDVAKLCEKYGTRVQDSVFEMLIDPRSLDEMKLRLSAIIDMREDSIRFYRLGKNYLPRIEVMGKDTSPVADQLLVV